MKPISPFDFWIVLGSSLLLYFSLWPGLPIVLAQSPSPLQQEIQLHFNRAMELAREKKVEQALAELKEVVRLDPQNVEAYIGMGEMYRSLKQWDGVLQSFQKAVELNPGHTLAHLRLGQFFESRRDWERARQAYEKVISLQKRGPEVREAAIRLEEVKRQIRVQELTAELYGHIKTFAPKEALKGVEDLLALDPKNPTAYYVRGYVEDAAGQYDEAILDMTKALELSPDYLPAKVKLGSVYAKKDEIDKAISLYREVIDKGRPEDENVKVAKEWLAIAEASKAKKAVLEEARTSLKQGDIETTQQSLEEAIRLQPKGAESYMALSILYTQSGQREKALSTLREAVRNNPESIQVYLQLGLLLEQMGQLEEAQIHLKRVISMGKDTPEATVAAKHLQSVEAQQHFQEMSIQIGKGDYESALREIQEVIAVFPEDASAYLSQGLIYDRLNKPDEAISSLRKAIELKPEYVNAHLQLAQALGNRNQFDEARTEYETILSLKPDEKTVEQVQTRMEELVKLTKLYEHTKTTRELYEKGKFQESLAEIETLLVLNTSNYVAYLFRGMNFDSLKQPLDAIDAFKRALEIKPKFMQARFQLARVYMDEGRFEEAREQYERIVQDGKGTREGDLAAVALRRLRNLSYSVSYGQALNSNIAQRANAVTAVSSSLNAGVNYILARRKQWRISVSGGAGQSIYYKSQGVGNGLSGSLSGYYQMGDRGSLSGGMNMGYGFFDGEMTSISRSASMAASINTKGIPTSLSFSYSFSPVRGLRSSISDTDNHSLSFSASQRLTAKDQVNMSYTFASSINLDKTGNNYAYRSNGVSMGYNRYIIKDFSGNLGTNLNYYTYSNPDSTTLFQRFRKTLRYGLSGGITTQLSEQVRLSLSYSYTASVTNIHVSAEDLKSLEDILSSPIPIVGGDYESHSVSINYSVSF